MSDRKSATSPDRLKLSLYFLPILGWFPAVWTLSLAEKASTQQLQASRLSLWLGLCWLLIYGGLWTGKLLQGDLFWSLRLLYLNGLVTTGYFLVCLAMLWRIRQGKTPRLPAGRRSSQS